MTDDQQRTFRNFVSGLIRENRRQRGYSDSDEEWVRWQSDHEKEIRLAAQVLVAVAPVLNVARPVRIAAMLGAPVASEVPIKELFETQQEEIKHLWKEFEGGRKRKLNKK